MINGIDTTKLDAVTKESLLPDLVPGRVLQLDGDCLAYECSGYDDEPFNNCTKNFKAALSTRKNNAGAEYCVIHLTTGDKGGRFDTAMVKEYQANRKGKAKPKHLHDLKNWIEEFYNTIGADYCINHRHQEADDGMAQGQYKAITEGNRNLSIIMSMDKDLTMCSGLHCDWNSYVVNDVDGFGCIYLDASGSSKKVQGFGTSFFWAQLLMGDTADAIPGLPRVGMPMLDAVQPLKNPRKLDTKPKLCGAVMAWALLKECKTDLDCMLRVIEAYQSYYGKGVFEYTTWRGDKIQVTSGHMVLEQAKLLWMRRVIDECPSVFFNQVAHGIQWDGGKV